MQKNYKKSWPTLGELIRNDIEENESDDLNTTPQKKWLWHKVKNQKIKQSKDKTICVEITSTTFQLIEIKGNIRKCADCGNIPDFEANIVDQITDL